MKTKLDLAVENIKKTKFIYQLSQWCDNWVDLIPIINQLDPDISEFQKNWEIKTINVKGVVYWSIWTLGEEIKKSQEEEKELKAQITQDEKDLLMEKAQIELDKTSE